MPIKDALVGQHEPWLTPDLQDFLEVIAEMFAETELLGAGEPGSGTGWEAVFDPDLCPAQALPYLAQFVGERLPFGLPAGDAREWIHDAPNSIRGTVTSIVLAAQRRLIGQRTVSIRERAGTSGVEDPHRLVVSTYANETPDSSGVLRDLREVVPADILLVYQTLGGQTWEDVRVNNPTWADVQANYANWDLVRRATAGITAGTVTYTRPRAGVLAVDVGVVTGPGAITPTPDPTPAAGGLIAADTVITFDTVITADGVA